MEGARCLGTHGAALVGAGTHSPMASPAAFCLPNYRRPAALPAALSRASPLPCQQREVATSPDAGTVWRDFLGPESGAM